MIQIKVLDAEKNIVAENGGQEEVNLTLRRSEQSWDRAQEVRNERLHL